MKKKTKSLPPLPPKPTPFQKVELELMRIREERARKVEEAIVGVNIIDRVLHEMHHVAKEDWSQSTFTAMNLANQRILARMPR